MKIKTNSLFKNKRSRTLVQIQPKFKIGPIESHDRSNRSSRSVQPKTQTEVYISKTKYETEHKAKPLEAQAKLDLSQSSFRLKSLKTQTEIQKDKNRAAYSATRIEVQIRPNLKFGPTEVQKKCDRSFKF